MVNWYSIIKTQPSLGRWLFLDQINENMGLEFTWCVWLYIKRPGASSSTRYQIYLIRGMEHIQYIFTYYWSSHCIWKFPKEYTPDYLRQVSGFFKHYFVDDKQYTCLISKTAIGTSTIDPVAVKAALTNI
jgi:hypothetical protein